MLLRHTETHINIDIISSNSLTRKIDILLYGEFVEDTSENEHPGKLKSNKENITELAVLFCFCWKEIGGRGGGKVVATALTIFFFYTIPFFKVLPSVPETVSSLKKGY